MQRNSCLLLVIIFFTRTCTVIATVLDWPIKSILGGGLINASFYTIKTLTSTPSNYSIISK